MAKTYCPECDAAITMENPHIGDMIKCSECGVELEVIDTNPYFDVDYPLDDDDWDDDWDDDEWDDDFDEDDGDTD